MALSQSVDNDQYLPLRETVYKRLRKEILTGELKPGERLMEIHLANRLDVSRTPIREAIRKLELEGLVKIIPRSGAQVARISEKELRDLLELRRCLDVLAAQLACSRITPEGKSELRKACTHFEEACRKGDETKIAEADVAFHDIIIIAADNTKLRDSVRTLADQMYRFRFEYIKDDQNYEQLVKEHKLLCEAITTGDVEKAASISREHIDRQEASILWHLQKGTAL